MGFRVVNSVLCVAVHIFKTVFALCVQTIWLLMLKVKSG